MNIIYVYVPFCLVDFLKFLLRRAVSSILCKFNSFYSHGGRAIKVEKDAEMLSLQESSEDSILDFNPQK